MTWTAALAFGDGVALVYDDLVALVQPAGDGAVELVGRLWIAVSGGGSIDDVVDALSADGAPVGSYAVAAREGDEVRVVERGGAHATLHGPAGATDVHAHALRSWLEHAAPAHEVVLRLADDDAGAPLDVAPVRRAVLPAARVECGAGVGGTVIIAAPASRRAAASGADDEPTTVQRIVPLPTPAPDDTDDEFRLDRMFGHTVTRSVSRAAVQAARAASADPFASPPAPGTARADLTPPGSIPPPAAPSVDRIASITLLHHLGEEEVADEVVGHSCTLAFTGGPQVSLRHPLLVGRNPQPADDVAPDAVLVKIEAGQRLSRTHALVHVADGHVLLRDLGSANGTVYTEPGRSTRAAPAHQSVAVEPGTTIDFGGAAVATVIGPR